MKFGKLPSIESIDFSLPADPSCNPIFFQKLSKNALKPEVFVGCTGWSMKEWVGKIYPKGTKAADYLKYYSQQFNTIELNTTHYRIPDEKTIQKWYAESSPDFKFCPKILQTVSHSRDLGFGTGRVLAFCESIQGLQEKLGCCFIQMPPYFGINKIAILEKFLENFPSHIPLAVEVRHESWFENEDALNELMSLLNTHQISTVLTDVAGRRDVLHMGITTDTAMIRFVGNNLHSTDYSRIDDWVVRLGQWFEKGLKKAFIFTHEPENLFAPDLALYLVDKLKESLPVTVRGPEFIVENQSGQMSLF